MILGSHNSWSYLPPKHWWMWSFHFMAKCQRVDIREQYEKYGVRCFDLRVRWKKWEMEVSSLGLCTLLKNKLNWESGKSYRVPGKTYPSQHLAVFDLSSAAPINQQ